MMQQKMAALGINVRIKCQPRVITLISSASDQEFLIGINRSKNGLDFC